MTDPLTRDTLEEKPTREGPAPRQPALHPTPAGASATIKTKVILGAPSPALLRGLETLILAMPGVQLVGIAQTMSTILTAIAGLAPDVAIVDLAIGRELASTFVARIRAIAASTRFILIIDTFQPVLMREALKLGVSGFIPRTTEADEILAAILSTTSGQTYVAPAFAPQLAESLSFDELTPRELQVLAGLSRGGCNKEIARELDVSIGTVKTHVRAIMSKLDSHSRTEVALKAIRLGLVGIDG